MKVKVKAQDLRELTLEELRQKEAELKRQLLNLRFQVATNQQDNTAALGQTRRDIARVKTVIREREREQQREREEAAGTQARRGSEGKED